MLCQKAMNLLLFPGLTRVPGFSERSKEGGPVASVAVGRLHWLLLLDKSSGLCGTRDNNAGPWMPGMSGASGEGRTGVVNSKSTRWRSFSSSLRRIISSKALNCSCSRCRRCISATRSRSASSACCRDCSCARACSSTF